MYIYCIAINWNPKSSIKAFNSSSLTESSILTIAYFPSKLTSLTSTPLISSVKAVLTWLTQWLQLFPLITPPNIPYMGIL